MNTQKQINNYIARQKQWVKDFNVKVGDTVLVLRKHESYSKGWNINWIEKSMKSGIIDTILSIFNNRGIALTNSPYIYPYTVLLKLDRKPEDYKIKTFESAKDSSIQKCVISLKDVVKENDYFRQEYSGGRHAALRKFVPYGKDECYLFPETRKGFFNYSGKYISNLYNLGIDKVVASTLTGIGLPILRLD